MIDTDENYHLTLAELVTKTDDSHANTEAEGCQ